MTESPNAAEPTRMRALTLAINGQDHAVAVEPRETLLDVLRERLSLFGTKKGCDHGQCGACTVLVDDRWVLSCLTLAVQVEGQPVTTIEGMERHPVGQMVQQAFVEADALQCGYCTPGQVVSATACIVDANVRTDAEIRELMSGNLCRCGAYPNIVTAIRTVIDRIGAS